MSASSSTKADDNEVELPESSDRVRELLITLFEKQGQRAKLLERSRELNEDMQGIKAKAERWMRENNSESFKVSTHGRKLKRMERKKYAKMTVEDILKWVEEKIGNEWRCALEKEIQLREKTVIGTKEEYRITYLGVRKRGEPVAPGRKRKMQSNHSSASTASTSQRR